MYFILYASIVQLFKQLLKLTDALRNEKSTQKRKLEKRKDKKKHEKTKVTICVRLL